MTIAFLYAGVASLLASALHDIAFRTVPNLWAAAVALSGLALRVASGDILPGAIAASIVLAAAFLCWLRGWMGGGDVKLLAAAALFVAPLQVPWMLVSVSIAGGALALPYLFARQRNAEFLAWPNCAGTTPRRPDTLASRILRAERWRLGRGGPLPYAVAICAGVGVTLLHGAP